MSPQFDSPDLPNSLDAHSLRRVSWLRRLVFLAVPLLGMAVALPAPGQELRFSTENDVFSGDDAEDDLYTFAVALEMERGPYTLSLRENAFTDRAAGARFDETYLSIGRALPGLGAWQVYAEAGAVHVGHGLFGEGVQNAVHRLLDQEEVELTYRGASLHPRLAVIAERPFAVAGGLDVLALGPRFEVDSVPGLRSLALAGLGRQLGVMSMESYNLILAAALISIAVNPLLLRFVPAGDAPSAR